MNLLKRIVEFYINSSIHVALAVYALVRVTELYLDISYNQPLDFFIFYATITGYNFIKYAGIAKLHHLSLTDNLKMIQLFSLVCFVLTLYYGWQLPLQTKLFFVPFIVITLLYAVPVFRGFTINLRNLPAVKSLLIAVVWAGVTVLLPVLAVQRELTLLIWLQFVQRFLLVVILMIPFDIRDIRYDAKTLQTLPQLFGVERAKKIGFILLLLTMFLELLITPTYYFKVAYLVLFFVVLFFLQRAKV